MDCYPGVNDEELFGHFVKCADFDLIIKMDDIFYDGEKLTEMMKPFLTEDRVRGIYYFGQVTDFIDEGKLAEAKKVVEEKLQENISLFVCRYKNVQNFYFAIAR